MNTNLHFSSKSDMWETPQDFFDKLNEEFNFETDVCALPENTKCKKYFTPEQDGLTQKWEGVCWMNPPYGNKIGKWIKKAYESGEKGATVVCLVPSRTDTSYWHNYCMKGEIRFFRGRLKFKNRALPSYREDGNYKISPAPFPSAIIVFRNGKNEQ